MTLAGARVAISATQASRIDLTVQHGRIQGFNSEKRSCPKLDVSGFLILPGLINAHDHLEFNLFPRLGNGHYSNATAWANDIYRPHEAPIKQHLQIPKSVRLLWGGIKNLLAGVTSVSHHNAYHADVFERGFPIRVVKRFGWAHSLSFCSDIEKRYRRTPCDAPFIIHAAEGSDAQARREIYELNEAGVLGPSTVIVHGVAMEPEDRALIETRGASIVWCPSSNCFILGRTLSSKIIASKLPIALGTDSALTAAGDFIDELNIARRHVDVCRLYEMITENAARILRLRCGEGTIRLGGFADLVLVQDEGQAPAEALVSLRPELVIVNGRIKLFSAAVSERLEHCGLARFESIEIEGRGRWFVDCEISALCQQAKRELGKDFRLAGKTVSN